MSAAGPRWCWGSGRRPSSSPPSATTRRAWPPATRCAPIPCPCATRAPGRSGCDHRRPERGVSVADVYGRADGARLAALVAALADGTLALDLVVRTTRHTSPMRGGRARESIDDEV